MMKYRDSEDSGETFPPEQPEADLLEADGDTYGAEEEEDVEDDEAGGVEQADGANDVPMGGNEDAEMAGAEDTSGVPTLPQKTATGENDTGATASEDDDEGSSSDGSEDIEGESIASDDEDLIEEEEGVAGADQDGDEDMEMDDAGPAVLGATTAPTAATGHDQEMTQGQAQEGNPTVKVH